MIYQNNYNLEHITEPINSAEPEIKLIVEQVLQLEKDKLSQKNSRYINEDILNIIRNNIQ
ncbi:hypothetical protein [Cyanobacterium sp. Dongsha4]|uniref:hypothetical protein n=1 Tax=Cyanobacterium sp. DS4 TaxID=2878255 RepID=UPI002E808B8E|nr:hypothetical protein [Cyanobacterium sp. Dongsha4]WVK99304.1 hypothetical protein Dongsha4_11450 [Cyanobacterium sp. Dongsha4]